jgi:pectate lyase
MTNLPFALLFGCAPTSPSEVPATPSATSPAPSTAPETEPTTASTPPTTPGTTTPTTTTTTPTTPVDCAPVEAAGWSLCTSTADRCEAVFTDGASCDAVCASVGLPCTAAWDDLDGTCSPDTSRPAVACDSGHRSDFCVCGGDGVPVTPPALSRAESLLAERAGFGALTTGGDPDLEYVVTSLGERGPGTLCDALESATAWTIVFDVDGTITWDDDCEVRSDKTVDGRGHDVTVDGTWRLEDVHDVIVSDLSLTRTLRSSEEACEQAGDVIVVLGSGGDDPADFTSHDLWFHHLELFDGGDGLIDIRGGTDLTISWSRFRTHKKATLAWQTKDGDEAAGMRVTWHHDHFEGTSVRNPRFHYGEAHFVDNLVEAWWQYGAASYDGARFLSEANVYAAEPDCVGIPGVFPCVDPNPCGGDNDWRVERSDAVVSSGEGNDRGYVDSVGDLLLGGARVSENEPGRVSRPPAPYDVVAEPADAVLEAAVRAGAGPRTTWRP